MPLHASPVAATRGVSSTLAVMAVCAGSGSVGSSRRAFVGVLLERETSTDDRSRVVLVIFNGAARP